MNETPTSRAKPELTDKERSKKMTQATIIMFAIDVPAIVGFWILRMRLHDTVMAFVVLTIGLIAGSAYLIYRSNQLRPRDKSSAR